MLVRKLESLGRALCADLCFGWLLCWCCCSSASRKVALVRALLCDVPNIQRDVASSRSVAVHCVHSAHVAGRPVTQRAPPRPTRVTNCETPISTQPK